MTIDSTAAKIGRSMKKRANFMTRSYCLRGHRELGLSQLACIHRDELGRDRRRRDARAAGR